jgi:serine/threonine protein phosphatase PrpC
VEHGAFSRRGLSRKSNEDNYHISITDEQPAFLIVADGMGGHNAGDLASKMAVNHIAAYIDEVRDKFKSTAEIIPAVLFSIEEANKKVFSLSQKEARLSGMGTTLTVAVFYEKKLYVAHIGDSRCYLIRKNTVRQITRDHSYVQELLDNGSITKDEIDFHPKKNIITRALGTEERLRVDCYEDTLMEGDIVLLCTDGLTNYVNLEEYTEILPWKSTMEKLVNVLGKQALAAGGTDDITIVAARYKMIGKRGDAFAGQDTRRQIRTS